MLSLVIVFAAVIIDSSNILSKTGLVLKEHHGPEIMIFLIFIISGLLIEIDQIKAGVKDVKSTVLALALIIVFAPIAAWLISLFPLETGVTLGLFIVAVMPTTLSSGIVMTQTAGGNMAHALFITILSNFIGIFSIPFTLSILLSVLDQQKELVLDRGAIFIKLVFLVLFPLIIGIAAKAKIFRPGNLCKSKLQNLNQWMIIGIVFVSLSGVKQVILGSSTTFLYILVLAGAFHLILLGCSFLLILVFKIEKGRYESIIFMGSQKTLALSVMIQVTYFSEFGTALLVCVLHHIIHLLMDGYLSTKMNNGLTVKNE